MQADPYRARLLRAHDAEERISDLFLKEDEQKIEADPAVIKRRFYDSQIKNKYKEIETVKNEDIFAYFNVQGKIESKKSLVVKGFLDAIIVDGKTLEFKVKLPLREKLNTFKMVEVDLDGNTQTETITIEIVDWSKITNKYLPSQHHFSIGVGLSDNRYQQPGYKELTQINLKVKASYSYAFLKPSKFDIGINSFLIGPTVNSNLNETRVSFFGFNGRIGYTFTNSQNLWIVAIYSGFYFSTMLVSSELFGYRNAIGPQIFPVVGRRFGNNILSAYIKFAPIGEVLRLTSFSDREIAAGGAFVYAFPMRQDAISLNVDFSDLKFSLEDGFLKSQSCSFNVSYNF